jgi:hypothetical protein
MLRERKRDEESERFMSNYLTDPEYVLKTDITTDLPDGCVLIDMKVEQAALAFEDWLARYGWTSFLEFYNSSDPEQHDGPNGPWSIPA